MKVIAWNLERKKPTTPRGLQGVDHVYAQQPDVMVLVEARTSFPARHGHHLVGSPSTAPRFDEDERTVLLWSANELERVEFDSPIEKRRFVAARTETPLGTMLILAVCIPWHMADVTYHEGTKRRPWELHLNYLEHLRELMRRIDEPFIVVGDFNQRVPRQRGGNRSAADALTTAFDGLTVVTEGVLPGCARAGIDHIALSHQLTATSVGGWPNVVDGSRLSDHDGAWAIVSEGRD